MVQSLFLRTVMSLLWKCLLLPTRYILMTLLKALASFSPKCFFTPCDSSSRTLAINALSSANGCRLVCQINCQLRIVYNKSSYRTQYDRSCLLRWAFKWTTLTPKAWQPEEPVKINKISVYRIRYFNFRIFKKLKWFQSDFHQRSTEGHFCHFVIFHNILEKNVYLDFASFDLFFFLYFREMHCNCLNHPISTIILTQYCTYSSNVSAM